MVIFLVDVFDSTTHFWTLAISRDPELSSKILQ